MMRTGSWCGLLVAALVLLPASALSQCGMDMGGGGGGGHDHGQMQGGHEDHDSKAPVGVDPKAKKNAQKLLGDPRGQDALLEAILEDPEFMRILVATLLREPEWRALVNMDLQAPPESGGAPVEAGPPASPPEGTEVVVYRCPMHTDVVSERPGKCPRCGMELERVTEETNK